MSFLRRKTTRALIYSAILTVENLIKATSRTLFVTLVRYVHKVYPEESDGVPAVGVRRPYRPKLVTETGLIDRQSFMNTRLCTCFLPRDATLESDYATV